MAVAKYSNSDFGWRQIPANSQIQVHPLVAVIIANNFGRILGENGNEVGFYDCLSFECQESTSRHQNAALRSVVGRGGKMVVVSLYNHLECQEHTSGHQAAARSGSTAFEEDYCGDFLLSFGLF